MVGSTINSEGPNPNLHSYKGSIIQSDSKIPVSFKTFLLRGCILRNTDYIIGCVTYTG